MHSLDRLRTRALLLLAAAAIVLVQALGLMHAVLHDHSKFIMSAAAAGAVASDSGADEASWPMSLFAGHDSQTECDRYDHMTHADPARFDVPALPADAPASARPSACHSGWHLAPQAAGFLARGPPAQA